jgi:hypothetical protein
VPVDTGDGAWVERKRVDIAAALEAIPNGRAHWFSGSHDIHAEHPDELADVMLDMVSSGFFR